MTRGEFLKEILLNHLGRTQEGLTGLHEISIEGLMRMGESLEWNAPVSHFCEYGILFPSSVDYRLEIFPR